MGIYVPNVVEGGEWVLPIDDSAYEHLHHLNAHPGPLGKTSRLPWGRGWRPFEVKLLRKKGGRSFIESDCPWLGSNSLVCREPAVRAFEPLLGADAEFLPLICQDAQLWLLRVWRTLEALDEDASDLVRFSSSNRLMTIKRHVFRPEAVADHAFFRLSVMPRGNVYVQDPVVEAAQAHQLRNVHFDLVWGSAVGAPSVKSWSWRNPPRMVTLEDIAATADEKLWQLIFLCQAGRVSGSNDEEYQTVKSWTPGLQMLYATQLLDDQVNNGGFSQYFFNPSGQFAMEAIDGFRLIGAHERAEIISEAVAQLFKDAPALRPFYQQRTIEAFMESYSHTGLGRLDEAWFKAPEFFTRRTEYIRSNPEQFVLLPVDPNPNVG